LLNDGEKVVQALQHALAGGGVKGQAGELRQALDVGGGQGHGDVIKK
jgi:hypothetical protein